MNVLFKSLIYCVNGDRDVYGPVIEFLKHRKY